MCYTCLFAQKPLCLINESSTAFQLCAPARSMMLSGAFQSMRMRRSTEPHKYYEPELSSGASRLNLSTELSIADRLAEGRCDRDIALQLPPCSLAFC